jgi:hypothetical protein
VALDGPLLLSVLRIQPAATARPGRPAKRAGVSGDTIGFPGTPYVIQHLAKISIISRETLNISMMSPDTACPQKRLEIDELETAIADSYGVFNGFPRLPGVTGTQTLFGLAGPEGQPRDRAEVRPETCPRRQRDRWPS